MQYKELNQVFFSFLCFNFLRMRSAHNIYEKNILANHNIYMYKMTKPKYHLKHPCKQQDCIRIKIFFFHLRKFGLKTF